MHPTTLVGPVLRTALPSALLLVLVLSACAGRAAAPPVPAPAGTAAAEEGARYARVSALREQLLAVTRWVEPERAPCDPGALRTFPADSGRGYAKADTMVREMERAIVTFGIDEPLDTKAGHALLRTLLEWEAGSARPSWDVAKGEKAKRAVAAGLTGDFFNEDTKRCEVLSARDTVILVTPMVPGFVAPTRLRTAHAEVVQGDSGLKGARDRFHSASGSDTSAVFMYTRVTAMVLWRDYAVVAVNRPMEKQASLQLQKGAGGATYIWRRVGEEWRLLAIARTWT